MFIKQINRRWAASLLSLALLCAPAPWPVGGVEPCQGGELSGLPATEVSVLEQQLIDRPTLADLLAYAYQNSPTIKAARAEWRGTIERYRIETSLDDPELMVEGMLMTDGSRDLARPDDWKVSLNQPLPLPGKLTKTGVVASTEANIARLKLDSTVRDLTLRLRETCQELTYLREAKRLAAANRELLDQLRKSGETAQANGSRTSLIDAMKAQAQTGQTAYDLLLLEESARSEETRLNGLLNRPPQAIIGNLPSTPVPTVVYTADEITGLAEANLEEIRISQANIDKAEAMVDLSRYETLPRLALGASYGDINGKQQVGVQAGLSLPLWLGKNAGRMAAARAEAEGKRAERQAQINDTRVAIHDLIFRLRNAERLVTLYRDDLIPQANRALETAETWYTQGQGSLSDYTETVATWYNFQLARARAEADDGKFLARLESLAGRPLTVRDEPKPTPLAPGEEAR